MKISVEIPDTTVCAFVSYVFYTKDGMSMGTRAIDSYDIAQGFSNFYQEEKDNDRK
jgi:hypothetical protein